MLERQWQGAVQPEHRASHRDAAAAESESSCGETGTCGENQMDGGLYCAAAAANDEVADPDAVHESHGDGALLIVLGGTTPEPTRIKSGWGENEADGAHESPSIIDALFERWRVMMIDGSARMKIASQTDSLNFKAHYADDLEMEFCLRAAFELDDWPTYSQSTVDAALRRRKKSATAPRSAARTRIVHPPEAVEAPPRSKDFTKLEEPRSRPVAAVHEPKIGSGLAESPVTAYYLSALCTESEACGNVLLADARVHALVGILEMQQLGHWPSLGSGADASTRNSALIRAGALGRKRCEKASLLWSHGGAIDVALEGWSTVATRRATRASAAVVDGPRASDAVLEPLRLALHSGFPLIDEVLDLIFRFDVTQTRAARRPKSAQTSGIVTSIDFQNKWKQRSAIAESIGREDCKQIVSELLKQKSIKSQSTPFGAALDIVRNSALVNKLKTETSPLHREILSDAIEFDVGRIAFRIREEEERDVNARGLAAQRAAVAATAHEAAKMEEKAAALQARVRGAAADTADEAKRRRDEKMVCELQCAKKEDTRRAKKEEARRSKKQRRRQQRKRNLKEKRASMLRWKIFSRVPLIVSQRCSVSLMMLSLGAMVLLQSRLQQPLQRVIEQALQWMKRRKKRRRCWRRV